MKPHTLLLFLLLTGCYTIHPSGGCETETCQPACNSFCEPCNQPFYCRGINEWHTGCLARLYAKKSLFGCPNLSSDYRMGYEQAFVDVAKGASGEVPALAPINYWHDHNRSACGHQKAQDWFAGYAAGASRALSLREPYNEVASSIDPGYHTEFAHSLAPQTCQ